MLVQSARTALPKAAATAQQQVRTATSLGVGLNKITGSRGAGLFDLVYMCWISGPDGLHSS